MSKMNPFMAFCLYVAARVFVQYLKKEPNDQETRQSMEFLLVAMSALKRKTPLTESFMVQLNLDIESSGLDIMLHNPDFSTLQTTTMLVSTCSILLCLILIMRTGSRCPRASQTKYGGASFDLLFNGSKSS